MAEDTVTEPQITNDVCNKSWPDAQDRVRCGEREAFIKACVSAGGFQVVTAPTRCV